MSKHESWPAYDEAKCKDSEINIAVQVNVTLQKLPCAAFADAVNEGMLLSLDNLAAAGGAGPSL